MACRITSSAAALDSRLGAKPPSSPTAVDELRVVQHLLQRVEDLRAAAQRLAKAGRADRQDHELLDVEAVVRMRAAVDDVHHRHRHDRLAAFAELRAEVPVQALLRIARGRLRGGQRDGQQRIGAEPALGVGAVELDHPAIEAAWSRGSRPSSAARSTVFTCRDGLQHAFAEIALLVAVAQLHGFARAGRCARGHRRAAHARRSPARHRPRRWDCRANR